MHIRERYKQQAPCRIQGCTHPKVSGFYCRRHRNAKRRWGHPEAVSPQLRDYQRYADRAIQFFEEHPDSKGLELARKFVREVLPHNSRLTRSREFSSYAQELAASERLMDKTDLLLARIVGMYLADEHHKLFRNHDHLKRTVGATVLKFSKVTIAKVRNWKTGMLQRPAEGRQGRLYQKVGDAVWKPLGPFFVAVQRAIVDEDRRRAETKKALTQVV